MNLRHSAPYKGRSWRLTCCPLTVALPILPLANVDEVPGHGGGGGHGGRNQVRAAALALPALEVAVAGRGAALARLELVGIHAPGTCCSRPRAIRSPPRGKSRSSPSASAWRLTSPLPGTTIARTLVGHAMPADHGGRGPQVFDPPVGARADEHAIERNRRDRRAGLQAHVLQRRGDRLALGRVGEIGRIGHACRRRRRTWPGLVPQVTCGCDVGRRRTTSTRSYFAPGSRGQLLPALRRPRRNPSARTAGRADSRTSSRPARSARPGRRPRSSCCRRSSALPCSARGSPRRCIRCSSRCRRSVEIWPIR